MLGIRIALILLAATCGGESKQAPKTGCDLAGTYRLRFDARVGQWLWFRFSLDKRMQATALPPVAIRAKQLTVDPDPAACKLAVVAKTDRGDLLASLTLDKKTNTVAGTLRGVGMREGIQITGVRDIDSRGPIATPPPHCVTPGTYQLVIPSEQDWQSTDGGNCDGAIVKVPFLVEYLGDKLVIDQLDVDDTAAWAAEDVFVSDEDPCNVEVRFRHDDWYTYTKLTFATDKVTAQTTSASAEVSTKGLVTRCEIRSPMSWVEKLK